MSPVRMVTADRRDLRRQVLERTSWLGQHALVKLVAILLRTRGYRDVRIVGRKSWRGRGQMGGADLACRYRTLVDEGSVLVQVKAYGPVQRRFVDELRGVLLREDCGSGIVFTTRRFSKEAKRAAGARVGLPVALIGGGGLARMLGPGIVFTTRRFSKEAKRAAGARVGLPVALIGGGGLARMLVASRIGVRRDPLSPFPSRLVVDDLFFESLQDKYPDGKPARK